MQTAQRRARVSGPQIRVCALEERLVPVTREARHCRVRGRRLGIPPQLVERPAQGELRELLHLAAIVVPTGVQGGQPGEDAQRLLRLRPLREEAGEVLRARPGRAPRRDALGEPGCVLVALGAVGRDREQVREPGSGFGRNGCERPDGHLLQRAGARIRAAQRLEQGRAFHRARVRGVLGPALDDPQVVEGGRRGQSAPLERLRQPELILGVRQRFPRARVRGCRRGQRSEEDRDAHRGLV